MKILESYPQTVKIFVLVFLPIAAVLGALISLGRLMRQNNENVLARSEAGINEIKTKLDGIEEPIIQVSEANLAKENKPPVKNIALGKQFNSDLSRATKMRVDLQEKYEIKNTCVERCDSAHEEVFLERIKAKIGTTSDEDEDKDKDKRKITTLLEVNPKLETIKVEMATLEGVVAVSFGFGLSVLGVAYSCFFKSGPLLNAGGRSI